MTGTEEEDKSEGIKNKKELQGDMEEEESGRITEDK